MVHVEYRFDDEEDTDSDDADDNGAVGEAIVLCRRGASPSTLSDDDDDIGSLSFLQRNEDHTHMHTTHKLESRFTRSHHSLSSPQQPYHIHRSTVPALLALEVVP